MIFYLVSLQTTVAVLLGQNVEILRIVIVSILGFGTYKHLRARAENSNQSSRLQLYSAYLHIIQVMQ